jgi:hypothetical protein
MDQEEATSSSKSIALTCDEHKKMKGKNQVESSSSLSSSCEDDKDNDDDKSDDNQASTSSFKVDEETIKLIDKVVIQNEDCLFTNQRREQRKK